MSTSITSILQQTEDPSYGSNACQRNKMHIDWKEKKTTLLHRQYYTYIKISKDSTKSFMNW